MGLSAAAESGAGVVGLFVIDPRWWKAEHGKLGAFQAKFWLESLRELRGTLALLNIPLVIRTDADPVHALLAVADEIHACRITYNKEYEHDQLVMDDRLHHEASRKKIVVDGFKDAVVFEEEEVLTKTGGVYSVYTPYANAYEKKLHALGAEAVLKCASTPAKRVQAIRVKSEELPTLRSLGFEGVLLDIEPGEADGVRRLKAFGARRIAGYQKTRDFPALSIQKDGGTSTSRLSAHLNAGTVSMRQAMRAALQSHTEGGKTFVRELIWRDFYRMIMFHHPRTVSEAYDERYRGIRWSDRSQMIDAWATGRTGYPLIDAAMRQLLATGFMHNRLRMIAAMFLIKDLDVSWVVGERFFMRTLVDYDQACNVGGWQWSASTGNDAAPYFRVMNPILQSKKWDKDGVFIRHFLPALKNVPARYIHAPWEMPDDLQRKHGCVIGKDYPAPIVDHAEAKTAAVDKYRNAGRRKDV